MTKEEAQKELSRLSRQIDVLLDKRDDFIKKYMHLFADFQIGQRVVNKDTLQRGQIIEHYQTTYGRPFKSPHHDRFNVHCVVDLLDNKGERRRMLSNTSRYIGEHPWVDEKDWLKTNMGGIGYSNPPKAVNRKEYG